MRTSPPLLRSLSFFLPCRWYWYYKGLPGMRVVPEPSPPVVDMAKVPLPGRFPATFMPSPQHPNTPPVPPPSSMAFRAHGAGSPLTQENAPVTYYLGYPPPMQPAVFSSDYNSGRGTQQLAPLTVHSQVRLCCAQHQITNLMKQRSCFPHSGLPCFHDGEPASKSSQAVSNSC